MRVKILRRWHTKYYLATTCENWKHVLPFHILGSHFSWLDLGYCIYLYGCYSALVINHLQNYTRQISIWYLTRISYQSMKYIKLEKVLSQFNIEIGTNEFFRVQYPQNIRKMHVKCSFNLIVFIIFPWIHNDTPNTAPFSTSVVFLWVFIDRN